LQYLLNPLITLTGHYGIYNQFNELTSFSPDDNKAITGKSRATQSKLAAMGIRFEDTPGLSLAFELYYRTTNHIPVNLVLGIYPDYRSEVIDDVGQVRSKGLELLLRRSNKKLEIDFSVTLSNTIFRRTPSTDWESAYFDNPLLSVLNLQYHINKHFTFRNSVRYAAGFPHVRNIGWIKTGTDSYQRIPTSQFKRYPYFRWDTRLGYKTDQWQIYLEIINLTNTRNLSQFIHSVSSKRDTRELRTQRINMLPRLPLFGFQYQF
jgi:hypothetical protein